MVFVKERQAPATYECVYHAVTFYIRSSFLLCACTTAVPERAALRDSFLLRRRRVLNKQYGCVYEIILLQLA